MIVFSFVRTVTTWWLAVTLIFLSLRLLPGDPVDAILGDVATPAAKAEMRVALGLERSLIEQYTDYISAAMRLTFGTSFQYPGQFVGELIVEPLRRTAQLAFLALFFAWSWALPLGIYAGLQNNQRIDHVARPIATLGLAIPNIVLAPIFILLFAMWLPLFPLPGPDAVNFSAWVMPVATLGLAVGAIVFRQVRAAVIEVSELPHVRAARAKGLARRQLIFRHILRNSFALFLTLASLQLSALIAGAVITERIFEIPGLGTTFVDAFFARDIPMVEGIAIIIATIYLAVMFGADSASTFLNRGMSR